MGKQPGVTGVQQKAKMVNVPSLQTAWSPTVQEAHMGEAPKGGGDSLPFTSALQEGAAGAVYLVIPVSDAPEQKAL